MTWVIRLGVMFQLAAILLEAALDSGPARLRVWPWGAAQAAAAVVPPQDAAPNIVLLGHAARGASHVYRSFCLECHDNDGRGGVMRDVLPEVPDFTSVKWHAAKKDAELVHSILEGKGKAMPRMKHKVSSTEVRNLVVFVRAFQSGNQVVPDDDDVGAQSESDSQPEPRQAGGLASSPHSLEVAPGARAKAAVENTEGARLFGRFCAKCHSSDGRGTTARQRMPGIPNFTLLAWQGKRSDAQLLVSVLDGKGSEMPSFREKLSRAQARDVLTHVRSFAPVRPAPAPPPASDFEARFKQLTAELEKLRKQSEALATPGGAAPRDPKP
jgi:mono/diheme cytochrome c family protein